MDGTGAKKQYAFTAKFQTTRCETFPVIDITSLTSYSSCLTLQTVCCLLVLVERSTWQWCLLVHSLTVVHTQYCWTLFLGFLFFFLWAMKSRLIFYFHNHILLLLLHNSSLSVNCFPSVQNFGKWTRTEMSSWLSQWQKMYWHAKMPNYFMFPLLLRGFFLSHWALDNHWTFYFFFFYKSVSNQEIKK